jgi:hypothetical protein
MSGIVRQRTPGNALGDASEEIARLKRRPPFEPAPPDGISCVVAEWANGQTGFSAFATTDTYSAGGTDPLPVWTRDIRGSDITDTGDDLNCTCGPGVYLGRATMWLAGGFDPATMLFDLRIEPVFSGGSTFGFFGSPHGVAQGFNNGTFVRQYSPAGGGPAFEYVAVADQWFVVAPGETVDISTSVHTDTAGLTFVANLVGAANPGASNLTIVRVGP